MALRKPSEYFKKDIATVDNSVQELQKTSEIDTFSDAFESFKNNLSKIEVLSEFSDTLDNYRVNIERVNHLSKSVEDIQTEIQTLLKKEDLDRAMMSQLIVVEQSIRDLQSKVKGINEKNLTEIRLDVSGLTESVNEFLEVEVPKYKKIVVESDLRTDKRFTQLEENVNQTLEGISEFVDNKYQQLTESLQGINEQSLAGILEDFKLLENAICEFKENEIPKYKGFIVETEKKTENKLEEFDNNLENKLEEFDNNLENKLNSFDERIGDELGNINKELVQIKENEIPKYKGFIVETERKTENKLITFQEKLDKTISNILEKVDLVEGDKFNLVNIVNEKIEDLNELSKSIKLTEQSTNDYKNDIKKKVSDLEINILRNETHIKVQNKNLETIQEEVKKTLEKIDLLEIEKQNHKLGQKIKYLEEVFEKFSENEILTESILTEPPSTDNKDPLTPLDQNFVTLDQLQQHYRLFINRIQQQLATIGGGGETRLEFLDDVDRNSAKTNGYVLQYDSSVGKFIGTSYVSGSGGDSYWSEVNAGIYTTGNVAIGTDVVSTGSTALWVQGDSQVVGKLTVSDLYFDGSAYTEINAGISTLNITSSTITIGSTLQPSLDSVYDLGSLDRQWKELYLSGATLYLAGVPISLTSNVNNQTTIAVGGTSLVSQPDLQAVDDQVQFLTTGVANVGFYDADLGVISTLTEIGTKTGIYTQGQSLSNVGIVTGHYFIVSKGGNNIGVGNTFIQSGIASAYIGDWIAGISTTQWGVLSYSSSNIVPLSNNSLNLGGQLPNYYLNYNNFVNTPTNLSDFSNDVGFLTTGGSASSLLNLTGASQGTYGNSTVVPQIEVDNTGRITSITQVEITGGSGGGGGSTIKVRDNNNVVGTASTLNFGQDLDVTLTGEVATINVSIPLSGLTDVNTSNLSGITTDYLMVYDPSVPEFKFVDPKTYFGINNDSNPDPTIDDFGSY